MNIILETSKGRFVVKELKYVELDSNYIKLSEITELEASEIVEIHKNWQPAEDHFETPLESLHSLIESQGIEITNNTYISKV